MPLFAQGSADVGKHTKKQLGKSYHGNVATYRDYQKTNIRKYFPGGLAYKGHFLTFISVSELKHALINKIMPLFIVNIYPIVY